MEVNFLCMWESVFFFSDEKNMVIWWSRDSLITSHSHWHTQTHTYRRRSEGLIASLRMRSNPICNMQIPRGVCTYKTTIIMLHQSVLTAHACCSQGQKENPVRVYIERNNNKKETEKDRFNVTNLFDFHTVTFYTRLRNTQIILFVFYLWPAGNPNLPSFCFAPSQTRSPSLLSLSSPLLHSSHSFISSLIIPMCDSSLSLCIHELFLIYIKYIVQCWGWGKEAALRALACVFFHNYNYR